tara:strand:- start:5552 stop:6115 length:564 start_codon:yes stop_codon:yes gene_type:complete
MVDFYSNIVYTKGTMKKANKEALMAGKLKNAVLGVALVSMLGACSTMTNVAERDTYAEPKWYAKCQEIGSEGGFLFWFGTDYVYSCGKGVSTFDQAAVAQAKTFALKGVAERIHSNIKASTSVDIKNESKNTRTYVEHIVDKTAVRRQLESEKYTYMYGGQYHTFMKIKMSKEVFESLINEAKATRS